TFYLLSTTSLYTIRRFRHRSFPAHLCRRSVRRLTRPEFLELLAPPCRRRAFNSTRKLRRLSRGTTPSSSNCCATCLFASPMLVLTVTTTSSTLTPIRLRSRFAPTRRAERAVVFAPQVRKIRLSWCRRERRMFRQERG